MSPAAPIPSWSHAPALQSLIDDTVQATLKEYSPKALRSNELSVTLIDLQNPSQPTGASFRGTEPAYPASVVKLFYLVAAHRWMEDGKLADTPELRRAMQRMIVDSWNEATHYVVDVLTDTTSGPELPRPQLDAWFDKRNSVNRYFASLGYDNINVNRKPWCEGPFGRESQSIQVHERKRNSLTTDATARLLLEVATDRAITAGRSAQMRDLLLRDPFTPQGEESQVTGFTGAAVPRGSKLWSKAGWTSETRHDAALVQLPNGHRFILVTFTLNHAKEEDLIPFLARKIIGAFGETPRYP